MWIKEYWRAGQTFSVCMYTHKHRLEHTKHVLRLIHLSNNIISICSGTSHPRFCGNRRLSMVGLHLEGVSCWAGTGQSFITFHVVWKQTLITVLCIFSTKKEKMLQILKLTKKLYKALYSTFDLPQLQSSSVPCVWEWGSNDVSGNVLGLALCIMPLAMQNCFPLMWVCTLFTALICGRTWG